MERNGRAEGMRSFLAWAEGLRGDEKGEAQIFCEHLFRAFGHEGLVEAGATLEYRVRQKGQRTRYADLLWEPRLLLEMKKRGEKLTRHYRQTFDYWLRLVPQRPRYVLLCNFDEFYVYDFNTQLDDPVDVVPLTELPERYEALAFLFPEDEEPRFGNDRVAVTRAAADKIARVFNSCVVRGEDRLIAQRFVLQCVVALFGEDADLLPRHLFTDLVRECQEGGSTYDLLGGLFRQMGDATPARGGRYRGVPFFNGGVFERVDPVELSPEEVELLAEAAREDWGKVQPQIFGALFQGSMGKAERHAYGAHFTAEADIEKVVSPTIARPWRERIDAAGNLGELRTLRRELLDYKVLDPACGSGDFLYVAYRELRRIELEILFKVHQNYGARAREEFGTRALVSPKQLYGIEKNPFGAELAKVVLALAKELAIEEARDLFEAENVELPLDFDAPLPLDNLDKNVVCDDALFAPWPEADAIVGNPPYQAKNKMEQEYGAEYVRRVRERYPDVPGRADYCVYWYRRAHDHLGPGGRAGLVGTNTIRQNYSREGSLQYITENGGTITEAVSTQVWSGEAVVHVSIANWVKGEQGGTKRLYRQLGDRWDSDFEVVEVDRINAALSGRFDVTGAKKLKTNADAPACFQGQTHGYKGFLLEPEEARELARDEKARPFLRPYMIADDLLGERPPAPTRYAIDLNRCENLPEAMRAGKAFERVRERVLPAVEEKALEQRKKTGKSTGDRQSHLRKWWTFWRGRRELLDVLEAVPRYIACSRVTRRPIFEFVDPSIRPNDALQVFPLPDDYSFGILQSGVHWLWFVERCSTLKSDFRYTSNTVFDSFPWPQAPRPEEVRAVAGAARSLRETRRSIMEAGDISLRELYKTLDLPGEHPLKDAHAALDTSVRAAYGMDAEEDPLAYLLPLNAKLYAGEQANEDVTGPGLPEEIADTEDFVSADRVSATLLV